jgi:hypothetical protein
MISLARATYLEALSAAKFAGRLVRGDGVVEVGQAARLRAPRPASRRSRLICSCKGSRSGSPRDTAGEHRC